ncbi:MAG: acetyl-CoA carboxylase biotin carboxyl carrier protein [Actinobacteria bacterium]|nr:acetyl-CoA carboxylase biotin carboxyl carrier protein [Actinomycetota bacterium]
MLAVVEQSDIDEVVIEEGDLKISIRKAGQAVPAAAPAAAPASPAVAEPAAAPADAQANGYHVVRSPMVGTFYRAPSPTAPPFVNEGDEVRHGQTLCVLEAMKLMNELSAELDGIVRAVRAEDGEPVEYGQELFLIEPL